MLTFIPARGPTLHLVGVCVNRIGKVHKSRNYDEVPFGGKSATFEIGKRQGLDAKKPVRLKPRGFHITIVGERGHLP
jgi:hypothetical protein